MSGRIRSGWAWRIALFVVVLAQLAMPGTAIGTAATQRISPRLEVLPGRYIVLLATSSVQSADAAAVAYDRRPGVAVDQVYDRVFRGFAASLTEEAASALMRDPAISAVYPDYVVRAQGQSLEPGIDRVDADLNPTRAGNGSGSVDVDVAVIDSGVGPNADLNIAGGHDCLGRGVLRDYYGHGTHVAGIVGARDNGSGVVGVAPGARIWSVRVLDGSGNGGWSRIICGMEWVAEHADMIEVANLSLGGTTYENGSGCDSSPPHLAICAMTRAGVTVVAAACNDNYLASICTPGKYPEVISVSAFAEWDGRPGGKGGCKSTPDGYYGCDDRRASFSNYGPTVDIAAIGVGVRSTLFDGRYGYWSGTSMATPHVTGAAALLAAQHGRMSPAKVRERLLRSAMSGPVPGDPDAYPEPILNVASLGPGTIDAPSSAKPGQRVRVEAGEIIPGTKATFRINGQSAGSETVEQDGTVDRAIMIPELPYGKYEITVSNHQKTLKDRILVRPLLVLGAGGGRVGETVSVSLKGYGAGESVLITFDTGAGVRSLVRVRASSSGVASTSFVVPPSTAGSHRVTGTDDSGHTTSARYAVVSSLAVANPVSAGSWSEAVLRGFAGGEVVELRWGSATGPVLRTKVVTASGSGSAQVLIPADSTDGGHSLWAIGDRGNSARTTVTTYAAALEPSATATATATGTATATVSPPELIATETATAEPTETPTPESTAEASTETPTSEPTLETATETPTPAIATDVASL